MSRLSVPPRLSDVAQQCDYVNAEGIRCRAYALKRDTRCFSHSERPDAIERRTKARMKGGLNARSKPAAVIPDAKPPRTIEEAEALLARITAGLLRGEIEPRVAAVASKLCRDFIKAHKDGHLEREVQELKRQRGTDYS